MCGQERREKAGREEENQERQLKWGGGGGEEQKKERRVNEGRRTWGGEALKQLELEGLVKSIPNKGVYVLGFSGRDIDDMLEIRYVLEGLAIQLAIERIDESQLLKIKEIYDLMEFYAKKGDQEKFNELNIRFHESIYKGTQSLYFEQLLKDINYYIHVTSRHSIRQPKRLESAAIEHREIYEAIVSRDKERAKEKIQDHIRKTQFLVRHYYENKEKN